LSFLEFYDAYYFRLLISKSQASLFSFFCIDLKLLTASTLLENPSKATGFNPFSFNGRTFELYPFSFKLATRFSAFLETLNAPAIIKN